jgi:hypothetical protein
MGWISTIDSVEKPFNRLLEPKQYIYIDFQSIDPIPV